MAKHFLFPMSSDTFYRDAKMGAFRFFNKVKGAHPLKQIYKKLKEYEGMLKADIRKRHDALTEITRMCVAYAGGKPEAKQESKKVQTVKRLAMQCTLRVIGENERARELGNRMNAPIQAPRGRTGVRVGHSGTHDRDNRFERMYQGGAAMTGGDLAYMLQTVLHVDISTLDDGQLWYAMKKALSLVSHQDAMTLNRLYLDAEARDRYRLDFNGEINSVFWRGQPFDTSNFKTDETLYACDLNGTFYAGNVDNSQQENNGLRFQHSSFLSAGDALCAGTIEVCQGRLIYISNNSGHYAPSFQNLLEVCEAIVDTGYIADDAYAMLVDPQKKVVQNPDNIVCAIPIPILLREGGWNRLFEGYAVENIGSKFRIVYRYRNGQEAERLGVPNARFL